MCLLLFKFAFSFVILPNSAVVTGMELMHLKILTILIFICGIATDALASEGCVVSGAPISCYNDGRYIGTYFYKPGYICQMSDGPICMPGDLGPQICQYKYIKTLVSIQSMRMSCSMQFPERCSIYLDCEPIPGFGPDA